MGKADLRKMLLDAGATEGPPVRLPDVLPAAFAVPAGPSPAAIARWDLADFLRYQLKLTHGFEGWEPEYHFARPRQWRFDVAWPELLVAVECEGGINRPGGGAHTGPDEFRKDIEKYNAAALAGWMLLRVTGRMILSGEALHLIEQALGLRKGPRGSDRPPAPQPGGQPDPARDVPGPPAAGPQAEAGPRPEGPPG
jgi:hypothetical protein